jgi:hypothetical protein
MRICVGGSRGAARGRLCGVFHDAGGQYLDPGETSEFFYMTPSVIPQRVHSECNMDGR